MTKEGEKALNEILAEVLKIADRREMLCRNAKPCPACFTDQVQLVDYVAVPAQWKCRHCKHRFTHEPMNGTCRPQTP